MSSMRFSLLVGAMMAAGAVSAAQLGTLSVMSRVGEPLDAKLTVREVQDVNGVSVQLASSQIYQRVNQVMLSQTKNVTLTVESKSPYIVRMKGTSPVPRAAFPLIVLLQEGDTRTAKLYNVKLAEAPAETPAAKTTTPAAQGTAKTAAPASNNEYAAIPSAASPTPAMAPIVSAQTTAPRVSPVAAPAPKSQTTRAAMVPAAAAPKAAPAAQGKNDGAVKLPLRAEDYDLTKPFLVKDGMTLWSIARLYKDRYPEATMDQLLVGFVRENPTAFDEGRVGGVKIGSRLKAPTAATMKRIGLTESWAFVRVNGNADARKAATPRDMKRAADKMKKDAPALAARAQKEEAAARREARKAEPRKSKVAEKAADPMAATIASTTPAHTVRGPGPAMPPPAAEPAPSSAPSAPSAPTATDAGVTPIPDPAPLEVKETAPAPAPAAEEVKAPAPVVEESTSGSSWLTVILSLMLAGVLGALGFIIWRQGGMDAPAIRAIREKFARKDPEPEEPVVFRRAEPTKQSQLDAASGMVENRMQADAAAARGFPHRPPVQTQPAAPVQPAAPAPVAPAAPAAAPSSGLNLAAAYVPQDDAPEIKSEPAPAQDPERTEPIIIKRTVNQSASPEVIEKQIAGNLQTARDYIGFGARDQAREILSDVLSRGTAEQKEEARSLLESIAKDDK